MKKIRKWFYILSPIVFGTIIGLLARKDFSYVEELNRFIKIPPIVFPIVWSILYIIMGIWAYLEEKYGSEKSVSIYWLSLIINFLFTPALFTLHIIILAQIIVMVLSILIVYIFVKDKSKKRYLLVPYIAWLGFALILMIDLTFSNLL